MGKIIDTYPDKRGLVWTVRLKTKTGQLDRPISKICLLQEAAEGLNGFTRERRNHFSIGSIKFCFWFVLVIVYHN